jgi:hypothetical protein
MDILQTLLASLDIIFFGIFFILINYLFYIIIKSGYNNKLKMMLDVLVFVSIDVLAIFILTNLLA